MPQNIDHLKRALEITSIILHAEDYISSNQILSHFTYSESESTDESIIKRSIATIRDFLGMNIFESKRSKGYKLKEEYKNKTELLLPLFSCYLFLSETESLNFVFEPIPFQMHKKSLYYLFLFQYVKQARKSIEFTYINLNKSELKTKKIQVYGMKIRGRKLFLIGYDLVLQDVRHYIFTQIQDIIKIYDKETYNLPNKEFMDNFYKDSIECFEGTKSQKVILGFTKESEVYILKEYLHNSQKFYRDEKDNLFVEMQVNHPSELFVLVSRYLKDAIIYEPIEWREMYKEILKKALENYE